MEEFKERFLLSKAEAGSEMTCLFIYMLWREYLDETFLVLLYINHFGLAFVDFDMCSIYSIEIKPNYPIFAGQNSSNGFLTE